MTRERVVHLRKKAQAACGHKERQPQGRWWTCSVLRVTCPKCLAVVRTPISEDEARARAARAGRSYDERRAEQLEVSIRASNRVGHLAIGHVNEMTDAELRILDGMGPGTVREIRDAIANGRVW